MNNRYKSILSIMVIVVFGVLAVIAMSKVPAFKPAGNSETTSDYTDKGDNKDELLQKFWNDVEVNCRDNHYGDNAISMIHLDLSVKNVGAGLSPEEGAERFKSVDETRISELPALQEQLIRMEWKLSVGDRRKFEDALGELCNNTEEGRQVANLF